MSWFATPVESNREEWINLHFTIYQPAYVENRREDGSINNAKHHADQANYACIDRDKLPVSRA